MTRGGTNARTVEARALVLGRVDFKDADLILQLFTDNIGRISAFARGARRSKKRFSGSLEPLHTLRVELTDSPRGELHTLKDAHLADVRTHLTGNLDAMTMAGKALNWVKKAAPHHTPEPELWRAITLLLDELNKKNDDSHPRDLLAGFGLRLLEVLGWGLHLLSCVSCGKPCPPGRAAWIHPERGGIICRECGGGPIRLSGSTRAQMLKATQNDGVRIEAESTDDILRLIDRALSAHMGLEGGSASDLGRRLK